MLLLLLAAGLLPPSPPPIYNIYIIYSFYVRAGLLAGWLAVWGVYRRVLLAAVI